MLIEVRVTVSVALNGIYNNGNKLKKFNII